jgi:hypothetical protein
MQNEKMDTQMKKTDITAITCANEKLTKSNVIITNAENSNLM